MTRANWGGKGYFTNFHGTVHHQKQLGQGLKLEAGAVVEAMSAIYWLASHVFLSLLCAGTTLIGWAVQYQSPTKKCPRVLLTADLN